ncbi:MAG: histidine phosphatase family protein [Micromonosporaceae bacterium]
MAEIVLIRHGETEWSAAGRHTSYTDIALTEHGEAQARELGRALAGREFAAVLCSPRLRTRRTAEVAGLTVTGTDDDLVEWDYGEYEGITTPRIREHRPEWSLWRDGCPGGESPDEIGKRIDAMLQRVRGLLAGGDVALIGHGHATRVTAARWIGLPVAAGGLFRLEVGRISVLGYEREQPVLLRWNC